MPKILKGYNPILTLAHFGLIGSIGFIRLIGLNTIHSSDVNQWNQSNKLNELNNVLYLQSLRHIGIIDAQRIGHADGQ